MIERLSSLIQNLRNWARPSGKLYHCSIHGEQSGFISFNLPDPLKGRSGRKYCAACYLDMMDRELEPLQEVGESKE